LLLCIADHFEPHTGGADDHQARARVERWTRDYPRLFGAFRDTDGRPPRHTFFYPLEQYDPHEVEALAGLSRAGYGEVEVHLHHDRDTAENLRLVLTAYKEKLAGQHGLLARNRRTGELAYGFVHGDWALNNPNPDGLGCGVNNELEVLRETGCYADFTMPSAPDPTQFRKINSIYYQRGRGHSTKGHFLSTGPSPAPADPLLLIQGPLLLDWRRRKAGLVPRIENGCLQASQPPRIERLDLWLRARIQVPQRPDWFFVKLHAHGANMDSLPVLLGEPMVRFHQDLAEYAREHTGFAYHYITAREMFNLVKAAQAGWEGTVRDALDYELSWLGGGRSVQDRGTVQEAQGADLAIPVCNKQ
jgi:hypothetical protein